MTDVCFCLVGKEASLSISLSEFPTKWLWTCINSSATASTEPSSNITRPATENRMKTPTVNYLFIKSHLYKQITKDFKSTVTCYKITSSRWLLSFLHRHEESLIERHGEEVHYSTPTPCPARRHWITLNSGSPTHSLTPYWENTEVTFSLLLSPLQIKDQSVTASLMLFTKDLFHYFCTILPKNEIKQFALVLNVSQIIWISRS